MKNKMLNDIQAMHVHFGINHSRIPDFTAEEKAFRLMAMREEIDEYEDTDDPAEELDALVDLVVFALGTAERSGRVHVFEQAWARVMAANNAKLVGPNTKRGSFAIDLVKPKGWAAPDLSDLVGVKPNRPKLLVIGHARHGKDTVCEILTRRGFAFKPTTRFVLDNVIWPRMGALYSSKEACFEDRVNKRTEWFNMIRDYTKDEPDRLTREILAESDIYCGMRSSTEFRYSWPQFDYVIWVNRPNTPIEPESSMELIAALADYTIDNNGDLNDLEDEVDAVLKRMGL